MKSNLNIEGKYRIKTFKNGILLRQTDWIKNLIVKNTDNGVNLIIQRLAGLTTYDLAITKAKIGTGANASADANTDLQTPIVDNIAIASFTNTVNTLTLTFFISSADLPNGTYKEFGLFCETKLFARSLITPNYTKATGEDTTIEYLITINN